MGVQLKITPFQHGGENGRHRTSIYSSPCIRKSKRRWRWRGPNMLQQNQTHEVPGSGVIGHNVIVPKNIRKWVVYAHPPEIGLNIGTYYGLNVLQVFLC